MTNLVKFAPSAPNQFEVEISFYLILNGVCYKACIDKKQIKQNTTNLSIWKCIRKYNIKGTSVSCVELNSYWLISPSSRLLTPPTLSMNIRLLFSLQDNRLVSPWNNQYYLSSKGSPRIKNRTYTKSSVFESQWFGTEVPGLKTITLFTRSPFLVIL